MKRIFCMILALFLLSGCAEVVAPPASPAFTIVVQNDCDDPIHGIGFTYIADDQPETNVLCTDIENEWIDEDEDWKMEKSFDLAAQFTARIFVISTNGVQYCQSEPIELAPREGESYSFTLTGNEQDGYWLK